MIANGYHKEAEFCNLLRTWFESEDDPGISALDRCKSRLDLRQWLLKDIDFSIMPPKTRYLNGIPAVTYEGLLCHLERKLQLYLYCPTGTYNTRAMGSQEVEQFFSTFRDLDPNGLGTPKPDDIPEIMAHSVYIDNARIDPERSFYMALSKSPVYPESNRMGNTERNSTYVHSGVIEPRDHFFDTKERKRRSRKCKSAVVSEYHQSAHGELGVRQYHRRDDSKIPAHLRHGLLEVPELD